MALSIETAKREMADALIEIFKLRSGHLLPKVESCTCLQELRLVIFKISDDHRATEPEKIRQLMHAWEALNEA